jgi:hypothetical protein
MAENELKDFLNKYPDEMLAPHDKDTSSHPSSNGKFGMGKTKRRNAFKKKKKGLKNQIKKIKKQLREANMKAGNKCTSKCWSFTYHNPHLKT